MPKKRSLSLLLPLLCLLAPPAIAQKTASAFAFIHISDLRQSANRPADALAELANSTPSMPIRPSFVIATGDMTASGKLGEYERVQRGLLGFTDQKIGFYAVPGERETLWNPIGKQAFEKAFGKTRQSFDYEGAHFVLLDSSTRLSHWGHFDKEEIDWLAKDLKRVSADAPIFLFVHHWMGRDAPDKRPIDNEYDLWPLFRGKNLIAIFTGHGEQDLTWTTRGTTSVMAQGIAHGSYHRITVSPVLATIERISKENPKGEIVARIPVKGSRSRSQLRAAWNDPNLPFLARRRPAALLEPRAFQDVTEGETGEYRLDNEEWKPLKRNSRDVWSEAFLTKNIPIGVHSAGVRITTSNREVLEDELIFEVEREIDEPTRRWAIDLKEAIQSDPFLGENYVYVSCLDKSVYALDKTNGKTKWSYKMEGEALGSPIVSGGTLYIGSTDGFLYALEAESGRFLWKCDTGSPIAASPAIAAGVVCIGGVEKITGVHADSGRIAWSIPTGGFFRSHAVTDGVNFYLSGGGGFLYAVSAQSGAVAWRAALGGSPQGGASSENAIASPATAQGRVYVCANDGYLYAFNAKNGEEAWKLRAPKGGGEFGGSVPSVSQGTLYVASAGEEGDVFAIDLVSASIKWQVKTGRIIEESSAQLAPDGASLAIIGVRGRLSVLETQSGKRLWSYELGPGNVLSSPAYDGKIVYTTTMARDVQALNAPGAGEPILRDRKSKRP